jgi:RNA polymerase sigma-70 factor (sigma-E family)
LTYVIRERRTDVTFESFMTEYQRPLLRFAAALTSDARLAEDIVADVLGRTYERWARVSSVENPLAYVRRMVVNEFVSRKRREKRWTVSPVDAGRIGTGPDHASAHADREALKARLADLPQRQRAAIVLRYYEDLPDGEIAAVLGCAPGTVRSLISRALSTLRVSDSDGGASAPTPDAPSSARIDEGSR